MLHGTESTSLATLEVRGISDASVGDPMHFRTSIDRRTSMARWGRRAHARNRSAGDPASRDNGSQGVAEADGLDVVRRVGEILEVPLRKLQRSG